MLFTRVFVLWWLGGEGGGYNVAQEINDLDPKVPVPTLTNYSPSPGLSSPFVVLPPSKRTNQNEQVPLKWKKSSSQLRMFLYLILSQLPNAEMAISTGPQCGHSAKTMVVETTEVSRRVVLEHGAHQMLSIQFMISTMQAS